MGSHRALGLKTERSSSVWNVRRGTRSRGDVSLWPMQMQGWMGMGRSAAEGSDDPSHLARVELDDEELPKGVLATQPPCAPDLFFRKRVLVMDARFLQAGLVNGASK